MGMLVKISKPTGPELEAGRRAPLDIKLDVGRTFALVALGVLCGVAALLLFLADHAEAAAAFIGFMSAILSGGFGLALGEKTGAAEAEAATDR